MRVRDLVYKKFFKVAVRAQELHGYCLICQSIKPAILEIKRLNKSLYLLKILYLPCKNCKTFQVDPLVRILQKHKTKQNEILTYIYGRIFKY